MVEGGKEELKPNNKARNARCGGARFCQSHPPRQLVLGKELKAVRKNGDLWWWYAGGAGGDSAVAGAKSQDPAFGVRRGKADKGPGGGRGERRPVAAASRHRQNDISLGRNAGSLFRDENILFLEASDMQRVVARRTPPDPF